MLGTPAATAAEGDPACVQASQQFTTALGAAGISEAYMAQLTEAVTGLGAAATNYATVLGASEEPLKPYNNHGVWFAYEGVPRFAETSHIITTVPLGVAAATALGDAQAILLANHGVAFVG